MSRSFEIGDTIMNKESGVMGKVLKFYIPTASEEQTMVLTADNRKYHAPTRTWSKYLGKEPYISILDEFVTVTIPGFTVDEVSKAVDIMKNIGKVSFNGGER